MSEIKISEVLSMLNEGKTRDDISTHFGITKKECTVLFKHPQLKGRRTKKVVEPTFTIIDDVSVQEIPSENNQGDTDNNLEVSIGQSEDNLSEVPAMQ